MLTVFILGFEKSGGSARTLSEKCGGFSKSAGDYKVMKYMTKSETFFSLTINDTLSLYYDAQVQK